MGNRAIENRIEKILDLQSEIKELEALVEALKDEIKKDMDEKEVDEIETNNHTVRYKDVTSKHLDTVTLKRELPDIYTKYARPTTTRRFSIA